jgi:hypothetical protein
MSRCAFFPSKIAPSSSRSRSFIQSSFSAAATKAAGRVPHQHDAAVWQGRRIAATSARERVGMCRTIAFGSILLLFSISRRELHHQDGVRPGLIAHATFWRQLTAAKRQGDGWVARETAAHPQQRRHLRPWRRRASPPARHCAAAPPPPHPARSPAPCPGTGLRRQRHRCDGRRRPAGRLGVSQKQRLLVCCGPAPHPAPSRALPIELAKGPSTSFWRDGFGFGWVLTRSLDHGVEPESLLEPHAKDGRQQMHGEAHRPHPARHRRTRTLELDRLHNTSRHCRCCRRRDHVSAPVTDAC